ncbi:MAG TPA: LEA type 2 family protein [Polyangiaceae bacterium]|nr:LEA type 2 family protein [Polyangiaceae bacterium]
MLARKPLFLALLAAATLAFGCVSKPTMKLNHAEVNGVQIGFPPSLGIVVTSVVEVTNPNSYDVAIRAMRGTATFADRYSLPIEWNPGGEGVWLPADRTTLVRVPTTVPVGLAVQLVRESYASPNIPFRIVGKADVTASRTFKFERDDYEVDERGAISRAQIEAAMRGTVFGFPASVAPR